MGSREFYMEVATAAELAQELYARTLLHYDDLMSMPIAKLIVELDEGAGSIYTIASALRVSPGQVDAFAETFLGKEDYAALEERSRYDGTVGQLVAAGVFYRTALKDIEQHGGKADPAMASALKRIGDMLSRLKGEKPSIEELTALLREVSPSATAAKDEDEGILEVGSSKRPDDDDDDGDPEGGGGGSAPFGGAFRAEDPGGTGGTSAAEHTATSAGTYTGWGSQFTEEQVSQAVMDGIIVSGAVVTATVMPLGAL